MEYSDFLPVDLFTGDYYVRNGGLGNSGIELTTLHYSDGNTVIEVLMGILPKRMTLQPVLLLG